MKLWQLMENYKSLNSSNGRMKMVCLAESRTSPLRLMKIDE